MAFHVNPKSGNASRCRAKAGNCPFGSPDEHFATAQEASKHWELKQDAPTLLSGAKKTIILSDIDGTLVRSSLVLENAAELHDLGHIDLGDVPERWRADMKNEALVRELAEGYREALAGRTVAFVRAEETVERLLASDENFYSTLKQLVEHKEQGHEVVLISGSPDFLVEPFANKFGFKFHASHYHKDSEGRFTGEVTLMAGSTAKQAVIEDLGLEDYEHIMGFGDTASDSPLLAASHRSILVDPTEETLEVMKVQKVRIDEIVRH